MIGSTIAHYRIIAKLGEGGMGIVYRASDTKLDRDVAIKVLPPEVANEPDRLARFEREAKTLASLNHPNIAAVYGVESAALIMELVEGPTLADRLAIGPIPQDEAVSIAIQIAEALEAAHDKSIVHRDLKPANVKLTPESKVKLLDFGLAKAMESTKAIPGDPINSPTIVAASMPGLIMGTAGYMSPEQAKGQPVDRRADIWSFGVVLHEMLTGQRLFDAGTIAESIAEVLKRDIDLNTLPTNTAPHVKTLLARCLDRNPKTRLRDIGEVRIQLTTPPPAIENTPAKTHTPKWPLAVAALSLALAPAAWFLKPIPDQPLAYVEIRLPENLRLTAPQAFDISADGSMIVFSAVDAKSQERLYLRRLNEDTFTTLPGTEEGRHPVFSPNQKSIAFIAKETAKRLDLAGGPVRTLTSAGVIRWAGNEELIAYDRNVDNNRQLVRVSANGGSTQQLFKGETISSYGSIRYVPAGAAILFEHFFPQPDSKELIRGIGFRTLDGKVSRFLMQSTRSTAVSVQDGRGREWLAFVQDQQLTVRPFDPKRGEFAGESFPLVEPVTTAPNWVFSRNGHLLYRKQVRFLSQLTLTDRSGNVLQNIAEPGILYYPSFSPDQSAASFSYTENRSDPVRSRAGSYQIWDLARNQTRNTLPVEGYGTNLIWNTNGTEVFFTGKIGGRTGIWRRDSTGAGTPQHVYSSSQLSVDPTGVSPDTQWLLLDQMARARHTTLALALGQNKPPVTILSQYVNPSNAAFSPDGQWIVFSASLQGQEEIFVVPRPAEIGGARSSSEVYQVSRSGGTAPRWRRDGKEILFISRDSQLMSASVEIGERLKVGNPDLLFSLSRSQISNPHYDVSSDGKRFLVVQRLSGQSEGQVFGLIFNWPKLLERQ